VYYIIRKEGNESYNYFRMNIYKKCPIHQSYKCGCKLNNDEKHIYKLIENFISTYKRCSTLFTIHNGKIKLNIVSQKIRNVNSNPHF